MADICYPNVAATGCTTDLVVSTATSAWMTQIAENVASVLTYRPPPRPDISVTARWAGSDPAASNVSYSLMQYFMI
jgi:hypothetical protein